MFINLCQNLPILVKMKQEFQAFFRLVSIYGILSLPVFIIKADCFMCDVQSEPKKQLTVYCLKLVTLSLVSVPISQRHSLSPL